MSHWSTSGVRSASTLPVVIHRKLARCQRKNGRICLKSQRSSFGTQDGLRPSLIGESGQQPHLESESKQARAVSSRECGKCSLFDQVTHFSRGIGELLGVARIALCPETRQKS